ncbi:hypothetical protein [Pseudoxanthomonas winnipegensis]|uniref:Uncharacterized protein n=1 Tax=Pseudoxanthomonas winnipegensis TaxID=2480810 RepID=A0A4Q8LR16_9GAMM|nr:hypothetical protein [Pseudoxanthomonas winnipegensis]RZZ84777.1 hypothetical protein EA663_13375 [Pseudoxanthomonas winnipegensis]TAA33718.1 hypothetical protein EA656_14870 [Pseudoxanthomonas winnipegensis]
MTDIFSIVPAERAIQILHPGTGAPVGLSITLRPDSHPKVQAALRRSVNAKLVARNKLPAATADHDRIELLVSAVAGWEWQGDLTFNGDKPECSECNVKAVLSELPWVASQIDQEMADTAAFYRTSSHD